MTAQKNRIARLALTFVVVVANLSLGRAYADRLAASAQSPNIVFILADDLGWGDVGFHGGQALTPNLDKLAREGVELTQHYVAPVCSPTRCSFMTGRYWSRFGVTSPQADRALPWETVTLPKALKSMGYDTCLTGKWHLGSKPEWGPRKFGFDHTYGSLGGGVGPYNHRYKLGPYSNTWQRDDVLIEEQGHVTDLIADEATRWIESRGTAPFFLYVPFTAIHIPIKEPDAYLNRVPETITGDVPRQYAACITHFDDGVGRILAALEKTNHRDDTLVVFTSDNGGTTSENNDDKYPPDDYASGPTTGNNLPLRGQKSQLYEGGIHVPAVVRWPGKLKPGRINAPVHIADWMPTLCGLAGYQASEDLRWDGRDVWPTIAGEAAPMERTLYWVGPGLRAKAVRQGAWKLITYRDAKSPDELFDLGRDPYEQENLAKVDPERTKELKSLLAEVSASDNDRAVPKEAGPE